MLVNIKLPRSTHVFLISCKMVGRISKCVKKNKTKKKSNKKQQQQRRQKSGKGVRRTTKLKKTKQRRNPQQRQRKRVGKGLINSMLSRLPFEMHLPSGSSPGGTYQYCGPGTKLEERLKRGDPGINELDKACKEHDIVYANTSDMGERHKADKVLQKKAWKRVKTRDSGFGEKLAAIGVAGVMRAKRKLGLGLNTASHNVENCKMDKNEQK